MANRHSIQVEQVGLAGRVVLDGTDISRAVRAITWDGQAGAHPSVTLELDIHDVAKLSSTDTELLIPEATAAALVALGWAPPDGQPVDGEADDAGPT